MGVKADAAFFLQQIAVKTTTNEELLPKAVGCTACAAYAGGTVDGGSTDSNGLKRTQTDKYGRVRTILAAGVQPGSIPGTV